MNTYTRQSYYAERIRDIQHKIKTTSALTRDKYFLALETYEHLQTCTKSHNRNIKGYCRWSGKRLAHNGEIK